MSSRAPSNMDAHSPVMAPPERIDANAVVWQGEVEKIGRGSSHKRLVSITDQEIYVCLMSGGVTRALSLQTLYNAYRVSGGISQLNERNVALASEIPTPVVLRHPSDADRDSFLAAVDTARARLLPGVGPLQVVPSANFNLDAMAPSPSRGPSRMDSVQQQQQQQQYQQQQQQPMSKTPSHAQSNAQSTGPMNTLVAALRKNEETQGSVSGQSLGSKAHSQKRSGDEPTGRYVERASSVVALAEAQSEALQIRQLTQKYKSNEKLLAKMKHQIANDNVSKLRDDLAHTHAKVSRFQRDIDTKEGFFPEYLRVMESFRTVSEEIKIFESRVVIMEADHAEMQERVMDKQAKVAILDKDVNKREKQFELELETIRAAFVKHDKDVNEYLDRLHDEISAQEDGSRDGSPHGNNGGGFPGGFESPPTGSQYY